MPERERLLAAGGVDVEVVEAHDRRPALDVEALQLGLELRHLEEELEREAERVPDAQRAAHPGELAARPSAGSQPRRSNSAAIASRSVSPRTRNPSRAHAAGGRRRRSTSEWCSRSSQPRR